MTLEAGDAVVLGGDAAHSYANPGTEQATFSLAVVDPGAASRRRPEAHDE